LLTFVRLPRGSPPRRARNSDKYIQRGVADSNFTLLQNWPGVNGPGKTPVRKISIRAMQVMLDMDLMNKIAREAATILELEG
jgi:hypothetical protein